MRAVAAYNVCVIFYAVDCVFINRSINQVDDIRYRIYCRVRRITSYRRYFIIPSSEYVGAFPCDCLARRICRYAYRRACFVAFTGNHVTVIIFKRYREHRQFFKMKIIHVEFQIPFCAFVAVVDRYVEFIHVRNVCTACQCRYVYVYSQPAFAKVFTLMRRFIAICIKTKRIPQAHLHVVVHKVKTEPACIIILVNVKYHVLIGQIIVFIQRYVEIRELIIRLVPFARYF